MSRPKRFGQDRNLVSDGTIECTDQWHLHHYLPMLQAGAFVHVHQRFTHDHIWMKKHVQFLFVNICFLTFFLLYFHGIDKFELKIIPTNVQFISRCIHLAKLWVDASLFNKSST